MSEVNTPEQSQTIENQQQPQTIAETQERVGEKKLREELAKVKSELSKYKEVEKTNQEKKLEEEGKFKELLESKEKELEELKNKLTIKERTTIAEKALKKFGASDEVIDLLTDSLIANHKWDEEDIEEAVVKLKTSKPSLFTTVKSGAIGAINDSKTQNIDYVDFATYQKIKNSK